MSRFLRTVMAGVCLALSLAAGMPARAQTTRTLTIQDGKVWIDKQLVPASDLPASLDLRGVEARYTYIGNARPVVELGDVLYVLDGPRLREVAELRDEDGGVVVFFRDGTYAPYGAADRAYSARGGAPADDAGTSVALMQQYAQALQEHSEELDKLSREAGQREDDPLIEQVRLQARQAAEVAQSLPRLEVQSYLNEVQSQNQALYELLLREWQMEAEAQSLALQIQRLSGEARQQRIEELRRRLDAIFELKQENRRREIQQLERQLDDLRTRLQRREQYRERIIQQRLDELTGQENDPGRR